MANYSIVENGKVINVIEADQTFADQLISDNPSWSAHLDGGNIGNDWDGSVFTPAPTTPVDIEQPETIFSRLEFFNRFTPDEFMDIYDLNNRNVKMLIKKLEMSQEINLEDQSLIDGVNFLTTAQGGSVLTAERAAEILTP